MSLQEPQRDHARTRPAWQAPATELIGREEALAHEAESAEVAAARDAFVGLRRQLVSLRAEVYPTLTYALVQCHSSWLVTVRFGDGWAGESQASSVLGNGHRASWQLHD